MTSETLSQVGNGLMKSVEELSEGSRKTCKESFRSLDGFLNIGEQLQRIETKIDMILEKLNSRE